MPMEKVDSARDDERTGQGARRERERSRRMTAATEGPTAAARTGAVEKEFGRLKAELSEKIERGDAHVTAVLSERIDGVRELLDQRINDQTRLFRAEFQRLEDRLVHETGALRMETGALRMEIASVKELLLDRMEQQEKVRAAEYAATKWSIRSMMAAMALLVAMMARFTLFQ